MEIQKKIKNQRWNFLIHVVWMLHGSMWILIMTHLRNLFQTFRIDILWMFLFGYDKVCTWHLKLFWFKSSYHITKTFKYFGKTQVIKNGEGSFVMPKFTMTNWSIKFKKKISFITYFNAYQVLKSTKMILAWALAQLNLNQKTLRIKF
jgi:hypothetical protein